jgi:metal-sulfur cluster biosynthetic enzyme
MRTSPAAAPVPSTPKQVWCGDPAVLARVKAALRQLHEPGVNADIVSSGRVHSLVIDNGEAVLTLNLHSDGGCGNAHVLAEQVFGVLRTELPDTDLYLRHEHGGCPNA